MIWGLGDLMARIFGVQMEYLRFVSWLFKNNFFMWLMLVFIILSAIYYVGRWEGIPCSRVERATRRER